MRRSSAPSKRPNASRWSTYVDPPICDLPADTPMRDFPQLQTPRSVDEVLEMLLTEPTSRFSNSNVQSSTSSPLKKVSEIHLSKQYFSAVWAKQSSRKHKIWTGDGYIEINEKSATLRDTNGCALGTTRLNQQEEIESGHRLVIGSNEAEIIDRLAKCPVYSSVASQNVDESEIRQIKAKKSASNPSFFKPILYLGNSDAENNMPPNETIENEEPINKKRKKGSTSACFKPVLFLGRCPRSYEQLLDKIENYTDEA